MPRPGPRPYECVRRAWHSDRHQPIRGSIIQQIFRLVNQSHSSATRKNREWQEKLPIVVFKAEEIMYSKANSEAEYTDSETLWDRLNDAVDTIIRKEEGMESEGFLQPCIEAALVLGCIPVRGSRSQRNNNPRSYLSPRVQPPPQEAAPVAPPDKSIDKRFIPQPSVAPPTNHQLCGSPRPAVVGNHHLPNLDNHRMMPQTSIHIPICNNDHYLLRPTFDCGILPSRPMGSNLSSSVYPLYHGLNSLPLLESSPTHFQWHQQQSDHSNVIYGRPVASLSVRPKNFDSPSRSVFHREMGEYPAAAYHMRRQADPVEPGEDASPSRNVFHREMGGNALAYHTQRRANLIEPGEDASPSGNLFHREMGENAPAYHMQMQASPIDEAGEDASPMDCDLSLRLGLPSSGG